MEDIPVDAPTGCPGTQSQDAGKMASCAGCPNQSMCASGQAKLSLEEREPDLINAIKHRLSSIRHKILILSGKGGVGKSSVSVCLARVLSFCENSASDYLQIGVLDLDLCGPSIPCMFGSMDAKVHESQSGLSPVFVTENLSLMSSGFFMPSVDHALSWRGSQKNSFISKMLTDVAWTEEGDTSNLDFLIIDTPPGTSDEHLSVAQYLKAANCLDGAIIVTTPQEVALSDVRKELDFCHKLNIRILGIVENMSEFLCPSCKHLDSIFPVTTGGAASLCNNPDDLLARIPLDPRLTRALDEGKCPFELARFNSMYNDEDDSLKETDRVIVVFKDLAARLLTKLDRQV